MKSGGKVFVIWVKDQYQICLIVCDELILSLDSSLINGVSRDFLSASSKDENS